VVIPGNPGEAGGDSESRNFANLDAGFRRHDEKEGRGIFLTDF
jgi:hypothetical protein